MLSNASYIFDDVCVDLQTCRVFKSGSDLRLEPKVLDVLVFLIEHRGRLVEKDELLGAVWKEAFVSENAMTRVIAQLRKALGDDPRQARYIKTVQTRGYLFVADVETRADAFGATDPNAHVDDVYGIAVKSRVNGGGTGTLASVRTNAVASTRTATRKRAPWSAIS